MAMMVLSRSKKAAMRVGWEVRKGCSSRPLEGSAWFSTGLRICALHSAYSLARGFVFQGPRVHHGSHGSFATVLTRSDSSPPSRPWMTTPALPPGGGRRTSCADLFVLSNAVRHPEASGHCCCAPHLHNTPLACSHSGPPAHGRPARPGASGPRCAFGQASIVGAFARPPSTDKDVTHPQPVPMVNKTTQKSLL